MIDKIIKANSIDLSCNNPIPINLEPLSPINHSSKNSKSSSFIDINPQKTKNNLISNILFPFDDSNRRNAHKYLENYSAIKPEINKNLLKFLQQQRKHSQSFQNKSEIRAPSPENGHQFGILNRFLNANERNLEAIYGKNEININSLSHIIERNITKTYLPINVNKTRKVMVPVGNVNGFEEKKRSFSTKKLDCKTQRHDEAKLERIFSTILKKKRNLDEISLNIRSKIEQKKNYKKVFINPKDHFFQEFDRTKQYYEQFDVLKGKSIKRHKEKIHEIMVEKYLKKRKTKEISMDSKQTRLKDKNLEEFQKVLSKIQGIKGEKAEREVKFTKLDENTRNFTSSFSILKG